VRVKRQLGEQRVEGGVRKSTDNRQNVLIKHAATSVSVARNEGLANVENAQKLVALDAWWHVAKNNVCD
jgi:hypothetical protein